MFIFTILLCFFIHQTLSIECGEGVFHFNLRNGAVCSMNGLGVDLYKQIAYDTSLNFAFSPYIISNQLSLLYVASIKETEQEFIKVLHLTTQDNSRTEYGYMYLTESIINKTNVSQVIPANIYWYNAAPDELFRQDAITYFYIPGVQNSMKHNFKKTVDNWVSAHTNHEVTNITQNVTVPDGTQGLYLFGTLNFYNLWTKPFTKLNKTLPFYPMKGKKTQTPMMSAVLKIGVLKKEEDNLLLLNIPLEENQILRITTNLHTDNRKWDLNPHVIDITVDLKQRFQIEKVNLTIPMFKSKQSVGMVDYLKKLGLVHLFTDPQFENLFSDQANFTGISQINVVNFNLSGPAINSVSDVITTIAKPSHHYLVRRSIADEGGRLPEQIILNHPFIYAIIDIKTEANLYLGRVYNMDPEVRIPPDYVFEM